MPSVFRKDNKTCSIQTESAPPETAQDPDDWGVAVLGPGTVIGDGEIVSAKTLLDRHHGEVKA